MATTIYALCDPDLQIPVIRYIGKTKNPKRRRLDHKNDSPKRKSHLGSWLKSLAARGEKPVWLTLTEVPDEIGSAAEILYIRLAREGGMDLVNGTDGGDGGTLTPEARKKLSICQLGKPKGPMSPAHRAAIGDGVRGFKRPGSASKYLNVCWDRVNQKWEARLHAFRKRVFLGRFDSEIEAAKAADTGARQHLGSSAKLNFPVTCCGSGV